MKIGVKTTPPPALPHPKKLNIRNISADFDKQFKGMFLGPSWTDCNYHGDICPGNICFGNIGQYQDYLSCCWPDFDKTLKIGSWDNL